MLQRRHILPWAFPRWRRRCAEPRDGYSLVIATPPDLPVFMKIIADSFGRREDAHRIETLVVADHVRPSFRRVVDEVRRDWRGGPLRLIDPPLKDRLFRRITRHTSTIHWIQVVQALEAADATHVLFHDVDLFLFDDDLPDRLYRFAVDNQLACAGIAPPWPGYKWNGVEGTAHLVSSWEAMVDVEWAKSFAPPLIHQRQSKLHGRKYVFDTLLYAQLQTDPSRIRRLEAEDRFVHFGFITGHYRRFQRCRGDYVDARFALLLLRLLIIAFDMEKPLDKDTNVPDIEQMQRGLAGETGCGVLYPPQRVAGDYPRFRGRLQQLIDHDLLNGRSERILDLIEPFDRAFEWRSA